MRGTPYLWDQAARSGLKGLGGVSVMTGIKAAGATPVARIAGHPPSEGEARDYRRALGAFPTGVTIMTAVGPSGACAGMTANSFASVSLHPPLILWSLTRKSHSFEIFTQAEHFAVNILGAHQNELALRFARSDIDRFAGIETVPGLGGAPLLADTVACLQCRRAALHEGGDHIIIVGEVEAYSYDQRPPLVFSRGAFGGFEPAV